MWERMNRSSMIICSQPGKTRNAMRLMAEKGTVISEGAARAAR